MMVPIASIATATSSTVLARNPAVSKVGDRGKTPSVLRRLYVGLNPTTPQSAAGTRTEPAVSVPIASGTIPRATAAAEPELDPPAILAGSCGLVTTPKAPASPLIP